MSKQNYSDLYKMSFFFKIISIFFLIFGISSPIYLDNLDFISRLIVGIGFLGVGISIHSVSESMGELYE